jgi:hypothetical protein
MGPWAYIALFTKGNHAESPGKAQRAPIEDSARHFAVVMPAHTSDPGRRADPNSRIAGSRRPPLPARASVQPATRRPRALLPPIPIGIRVDSCTGGSPTGVGLLIAGSVAAARAFARWRNQADTADRRSSRSPDQSGAQQGKNEKCICWLCGRRGANSMPLLASAVCGPTRPVLRDFASRSAARASALPAT